MPFQRLRAFKELLDSSDANLEADTEDFFDDVEQEAADNYDYSLTDWKQKGGITAFSMMKMDLQLLARAKAAAVRRTYATGVADDMRRRAAPRISKAKADALKAKSSCIDESHA